MCYRVVACGVLAFLLALPVGVRAAPITLFDNFGSGNSYYTDAGFAVSGRSRGTDAAPVSAAAMRFTPLDSASVTQIDLALTYSGLQSYEATVSLWTNAGGSLGTQLGSWTVTSPQHFGHDQCCGYVSITGISGIDLDSSQSYYLVAYPAEYDSNFVWNFTSDYNWQNPPPPTGAVLFTSTGTSWYSPTSAGYSTFRVLGTVPDPAFTLLLFGAAISGIAAVRRRWR